jgi:tetratricopeptide (TPR) repeat protein
MDERLKQLLNQGRDLYDNREFEKAEKVLVQVLRENRGFADVHNMLGVIYHELGRLTQARDSFEQALKINPNYTEAALNLAVTYNELGQYEKAKDVYTETMARSRSQPRSLDPFAKGKLANMHADLGDAYHGIGFYAEAVREYENALALCSTFVDIRTKLANTHRDMGNIDRAIKEYRKVIDTNPSYLSARLQLGVTLYAAKRTEEAVAAWREVLEQDPENKNAQMYLKMVTTEKPDDAEDSDSATK